MPEKYFPVVMQALAGKDYTVYDPSNCVDIDPFEIYQAATVEDSLGENYNGQKC